MATEHAPVRKGYDIPVEGPPTSAIEDVPAPATVAVTPREFHGIKLKLLVQEGDAVLCGTPLFADKRDLRVQVCSPAAGRVRAIVRGERRVVEQVVVDCASEQAALPLERFTAQALLQADRDALVTRLAQTGLLSLLQTRPFSRPAFPAGKPKAIFVNAMGTAPFQPDANVALQGQENAFQAGLNALTRLTDGKVHLCRSADGAAAPALVQATQVEHHTFSGPHPAGNASVHIAAVDPLRPGQTVWVARAADVALIGESLLTGAYPATRIVSLAGPGVRPPARKHYRIRAGAALDSLLHGRLEAGEIRTVHGDLLSGRTVDPRGYLPHAATGFCAIAEGRERVPLGWLKPGGRLSFSRAYASGWNPGGPWKLTTNRNGGHRAMVLTGLYDRVMPLPILVDYLVRAVLACDTDEAVSLGLLETDPEDFALCEFICPCKTEIQSIIRRGLDLVEEEGL